MAKIKLLQSILINCLIIFVTAVPSSHHSEKCSNESHDCQEAQIVQRDPIDPINGIPIAFGDFDSDGLIDVFLLTEDGETIRALKGMDCVDIKASSGSRNCLADRWSSQLECNLYQVVVNLVLSDFNGDNRLDLLVTLKNEDDQSLDVMLVLGNSLHNEVFTCQKKLLLFEGIHTQPLVLDYNGDMISEFIITYKDCPTYLWNGGISVRDSQHLFESAQSHFHGLSILRQKAICLNLSAQRTFAFAQPHSSAFVNLNHYQYNLSPDIYLNGKDKFEYVYNVAGKGFLDDKLGIFKYSNTVVHSYPNYKVRGQSAFMDMNYSGQMHHLIPVCLDSNARSFSDCQKIGVLAYDLKTKNWNNVLHPTPESGVNPTNRTLSFKEQNFFGDVNLVAPVTLRIGDLNNDGYPDFATILVEVEHYRKGFRLFAVQTFAAIYLNVQDQNYPYDQKKRLFQLSWLSEVIEFEPVVMVTLFDLYNNGRLSLLMTTWSQVKQEYVTKPYDYYMEKGLYYSSLRVMVISGRCSDKSTEDKCPAYERNESTLAFGTNPHGPMACIAGAFSTLHTCGTQLSQSAHFALQLPFMVFGLGDVQNVVTELQISIPNGAKKPEDRVQRWHENIPGSSLVIVPYPLDDKSKWDFRRERNEQNGSDVKMSIYWMILLALLIFLGLTVLVVAIYVLCYREKKEDTVGVIPF